MEEKQKEMDWKEALNVMREQHVAVRRKGWSDRQSNHSGYYDK